MRVQSLGWKDPLEKDMATHSSIPAWEIPWTKESGRLQSTQSQRVRHNLATEHTHTLYPLPGARWQDKRGKSHSDLHHNIRGCTGWQVALSSPSAAAQGLFHAWFY